ncbi:hypothetical protein [Mycobacterium sp. C31M]
MGPRGIPTEYKGIIYRSRHEARYAALWDWLGWRHTYEPFDADGYIPDFLIEGNYPLIVEVKPAATRHELEAEIPKVLAGLKKHWQHDFLLVGYSPFPSFDDVMSGENIPVIGLLSDENGWSDVGPGHWFRCQECNTIGVFHGEGSYRGRPCGHWDGDHHLGSVNVDFIREGWAHACNVTKWRP